MIPQPDVTAYLVLALTAALGLGLVLLVWRGRATQDHHARTLAHNQTEVAARLQTLADVMAGRLDNVTHRVGQSLLEQTRHTADNLAKMHERLAVIDSARASLVALATDVVDLKSVLANKQARGAFGQARLEAIVADGLPQGRYEFQATLSNNTRPDCLIHLPNTAEKLVIDAKFPLEAFHALREASDEATKKLARQRARADVQKHIKDIAEKYLLPAETQNFALMFVPSESLFADVHEAMPDLLETAMRHRVILVSPSLTLMGVHIIQTLVRDARMREEALQIQRQVGLLVKDVTLLGERAAKLGTHFQQTARDVEEITTSVDRITRRGARIAAVDLDDDVVTRFADEG